MLVSGRKRKQAVLHFKDTPICYFRIKYFRGKEEKHLKRKLFPLNIHTAFRHFIDIGKVRVVMLLWSWSADTPLLSLWKSFGISHQLCDVTLICPDATTAEVQSGQCLVSANTKIRLFPLKTPFLHLLPQKAMQEKPENYIAPSTYSCFYGFISTIWEIA